MQLRKRNKRKGIATIITAVIMITTVALLGGILVIFAGSNFSLLRGNIGDILSQGSNKIKETLQFEDIWFSHGIREDGVIVYSLSSNNISRSKEWISTSSSWGSELQGVPQNSGIAFVIMGSSTLSKEILSVSGSLSDGFIYVQHFDGIQWINDWNDDADVEILSGESFDIAIEQSSGRALVVYRDGANTTHPYYRLWDGSTWTTEQSVGNINAGADVEWVKLASKSSSNEVALGWSDASDDLHVMIWNGTDWGNELSPLPVTNLQSDNLPKFDLAYERGGDELLVLASSNSVLKLRYLTWNGTTWSGIVTYPSTNLNDKPRQISIAPSLTNDDIFIAFCADTIGTLWAARWDGASDGISNLVSLDTTAGCTEWKTVEGTNFALSPAGAKGKALIVYKDNEVGNLDWALWDGSSWSVQTDFASVIGQERGIGVYSVGASKALAVLSNSTGDLHGFLYNGTSWENTVGGTPISSGLRSDFRPFDFAPGKSVQVTVGNVSTISLEIKKIYFNGTLQWSGTEKLAPKEYATIMVPIVWTEGFYTIAVETGRGNTYEIDYATP